MVNTDLGGITSGATISNAQDKFWANTIVFMDKLQPLPVIKNSNGSLSLNSSYVNYQWFQNGNRISNDSIFNINEDGVYYVEVELNGGCKFISDTVTVNSIMPNVFTPNNDGMNDYFKPIKTIDIKNATISIYNRWGQKLYESNDLTKGWDGKFNNQNCSEGVYYWILKYTVNDELVNHLKGTLTLLR